MHRKLAAGVLAFLVLVSLMLGGTVCSDGNMVSAEESPHVADMPSDISDGESAEGLVTFFRIISVLAMALFLVWYIRRKMKL